MRTRRRRRRRSNAAEARTRATLLVAMAYSNMQMLDRALDKHGMLSRGGGLGSRLTFAPSSASCRSPPPLPGSQPAQHRTPDPRPSHLGQRPCPGTPGGSPPTSARTSTASNRYPWGRTSLACTRCGSRRTTNSSRSTCSPSPRSTCSGHSPRRARCRRRPPPPSPAPRRRGPSSSRAPCRTRAGRPAPRCRSLRRRTPRGTRPSTRSSRSTSCRGRCSTWTRCSSR
mmetsp:Transcript_25516/g.66638  ORF Transcript_25516/g.66638 Transcript_25516/m.66638 type:complete len:227 (+) Transcript_25516:149-829(+)